MIHRGIAGRNYPGRAIRRPFAVVAESSRKNRIDTGALQSPGDGFLHPAGLNPPPSFVHDGPPQVVPLRSALGSPNFESVQMDIESSFRSLGLSHDKFGRDHNWHYHPEFELVWVRHGEGTRFIGDSIEPYGDDDVVLIGSNLPHCYHQACLSTADSPDSAAVVLQFRPEIFQASVFELAELRPIEALLRDAKFGLQVRGRSAERVRSLMRDLPEAAALPRLIGLLEILDTLACAGSDLRRLASADYDISDDLAERNRRRIETVHSYVRANMAYDINQAEAARLTGLTPSAFSRFFRKMTGQTFVRFVNSVRVTEACRRLAETNECITEIAFSCGYWSIANFNRQFSQLKRMNPTQFREHRSQLHVDRLFVG
jgi:AraC-like DNA-binding protein